MKSKDENIHRQTFEMLQQSLDGAIDDGRMIAIEQHLATCLQCRHEAQSLRKLDQDLKGSLQSRWPAVPPSPEQESLILDHIDAVQHTHMVRQSATTTLRNAGWVTLVALFVFGLIWTIKTLLPLPAQGPAAVITNAGTPQTQPSTLTPSPTTDTVLPVMALPAGGTWVAAVDFGKLVITINDYGTSVIRVDFQFSNWTCASLTHTGPIVDASTWPIDNGKFSMASTFDKDATVHMYVDGTYDPNTEKFNGTWQEVANGTTCAGGFEAFPSAPIANLITSGAVNLFPGVTFNFSNEMPDSPTSLTVYRQQLSEPVTAELARQIGTQWGVAGGVYSSPSEGGGEVTYDVMDGARSIRFLHFPDQFIYSVGYLSHDYGSALMDSGFLPSYDTQVQIAENFLRPFGILDLPYVTQPLETERGMIAFIPLLDGFPVYQEIGVDRSNIGWIDVKVSPPGQVTMVEYSHHDFQPTGEYPLLSPQQAWDRFSNDSDRQRSRYAVLSPEHDSTYQSWVPKFAPGQQADIYGWVDPYQPVDPNQTSLVMINNLPVIGDIASMIPENRMNVRFVHAWGQVDGSPTDGVALRVAGWEVSNLTDQNITGTISTQTGQVQLITLSQTFTLVNPPSDIPDGIQVSVRGVVVEGNPPAINWTYIESGEIPITYGASTSCGGSGSGGYYASDANFGGGNFALLNLSGQSQPAPTQPNQPFNIGDSIAGATGEIYVTNHIFPNGSKALEVYFWHDKSANMDGDWGYSLVGDNLGGIEQYNRLPIRIWGTISKLNTSVFSLTVDRYEPVYPDVSIHAWTGTEQLVTVDGRQAVLFTTSQGESYILKSSVDYPPADANIIGRLGDLIEIEGYLIPDQQVGGYQLLRDTAGTAQPDGVVDSAQIETWDESSGSNPNPASTIQGQVTIDKIELAYDATNLDRCESSAANDPNLAPYLYVQPMWQFSGHFEDGRRIVIQVQALPDEYLQ